MNDSDKSLGMNRPITRRNTFPHNDVTLIAPGGTYALEDPEDSPAEAAEILDELGVDAGRQS